jgi:hypothetical protein
MQVERQKQYHERRGDSDQSGALRWAKREPAACDEAELVRLREHPTGLLRPHE